MLHPLGDVHPLQRIEEDVVMFVGGLIAGAVISYVALHLYVFKAWSDN